MTNKQIETCREIRLWVGQVIVPAIAFTVTVSSFPEVRQMISKKVRRVRTSIKNKKMES